MTRLSERALAEIQARDSATTAFGSVTAFRDRRALLGHIAAQQAELQRLRADLRIIVHHGPLAETTRHALDRMALYIATVDAQTADPAQGGGGEEP